MQKEQIIGSIDALSREATTYAEHLNQIREAVSQLHIASGAAPLSPFVIGMTVFVLAVFVGYYVVWKVTPALHSPLMSVTNAISSVIIVGAVLATGSADVDSAKWFGFVAVILAAINIFGGFIVTQRMLSMFTNKK